MTTIPFSRAGIGVAPFLPLPGWPSPPGPAASTSPNWQQIAAMIAAQAPSAAGYYWQLQAQWVVSLSDINATQWSAGTNLNFPGNISGTWWIGLSGPLKGVLMVRPAGLSGSFFFLQALSRPLPPRVALAGAPQAGLAGGDCNCEGEIPLDPRVYAAVQWDLSQFNCPGCGRLGLPLMAFSPSIKPPPPGCTKYCTVDDRGKIVCFDDCPPRTLAGASPMNQMTVPAFLRPGAGAPRTFSGVGRLGAATDVFSGLTAAQQAWVLTTLQAWLSSPATQSWYNINSSLCPGVALTGMDLTNAKQLGDLVACFQAYTNAQGQSSLNTSGILDSNTLSALIAWNGAAGGGACPGNCAGAASASTSSSTTYWIVGGVAVAALIGGIWYATSRSHHGRGAAQAYEGAY
jgi:hypothetical protein